MTLINLYLLVINKYILNMAICTINFILINLKKLYNNIIFPQINIKNTKIYLYIIMKTLSFLQ